MVMEIRAGNSVRRKKFVHKLATGRKKALNARLYVVGEMQVIGRGERI
jgi:hypothetical protein